jgi:2'-5' RNA ligase
VSNQSETKVRVFLGIFPPAGVVEDLARVQHEGRGHFVQSTLRWTPPQQIHITLQFLGSVRQDDIPPLSEALSDVCAAHRPMRLRAMGLGCFPNVRRPSVLWAGVEGDVDPLQALYSAVARITSRFGVVPETRPYHPHLTLARIKQISAPERRLWGTFLEKKRLVTFGSGWESRELRLVRSDLHPAGSTYSVLNHFLFRAS